MTWSNIETCYDLAYYILNNMWRSTVADGDDTYNLKVNDRSILRMLSGEDGYYYLDSTKAISYSNQYIYNTDLTTDNTAETKFTPINNLGYESNVKYGDTTDTKSGINFHFTLHAFGSFVYNADDDLYFYFDGDDDVYFYINGKLAMDLGGAHSHCDAEIKLNDIADQLGLVDGGIYSFDMFYAERHTTQANLEFKTNIKIMDTMSITSKGQYNATNDEPISYGAIVNTGTTVAYSFNLLNLRSVNITNISFEDESLGSKLSKDSITLYDSDKTNGASTDISEIKVYYHTYDRPAPNEQGVLNTDIPQTKTVDEIKTMIIAANTANNGTYASLEKGSYVVSISNEDELKSLLEIGIPIDTQIRIYGIKRNVVDTDRPYINTVTSRAYYTSNGKQIALNGTASQKLTVLNSFTLPVEKEPIVVDYGKTIRIDLANVTSNINLNDKVTATFYGLTKNGSHEQIRLTIDNVLTEFDKIITPISGNGTYCLREENSKQYIEFTPNKFLSEVEKVYAVYKIVDTSLSNTDYEVYYLLVEVDIIPASIVYYETDFSNIVFDNVTTSDKDQWKTNTVENDNLADGPQNDGTVGTNTYGYDSTYENDKYLSNGSSLFVEGQGIKLNENTQNYTYSRFSFTGTGFDLISRTGAEQGAIRVDIYSDAAYTNKIKSVTVLNKSESNLELYQIPVVSVNNLPYAKYYVSIGVNAAYNDDKYPQFNRGGEFYFDAIRIYDPIDVKKVSDDANITKSAYKQDGEYAPEITEVRSILLDSTNYDSSVENDGSLFVDGEVIYTKDEQGNFVKDEQGNFVIEIIQNVEVGKYKTIGPNNEVYLTPGQAIAFKIKVDKNNISSIDIGAKTADGNPVKLSATISNAKENPSKTKTLEKEILSSTSLYYDLCRDDEIVNYLSEDGTAYILITNTGNEGSILSITDIKVAYNDDTATTATFFADEDVLSFARFCLTTPVEKNYDIQSAEVVSIKNKLFKTTYLEVVTSTDVERLEIKDKYGINVLINTSYVDNEDGTRTWTVKFIQIIPGKKSYTITGFGADGTSGTSVTLDMNIKLFN